MRFFNATKFKKSRSPVATIATTATNASEASLLVANVAIVAGEKSKNHNASCPLTKIIAEQAGYLDLNQFKAALTGELIPCPRHGWKWLYKTWCASKCVQRHKDCIFVS